MLEKERNEKMKHILEAHIFWTLTACHHFSQNLLNSRSGEQRLEYVFGN